MGVSQEPHRPEVCIDLAAGGEQLRAQGSSDRETWGVFWEAEQCPADHEGDLPGRGGLGVRVQSLIRECGWAPGLGRPSEVLQHQVAWSVCCGESSLMEALISAAQ